MSSAFDFDAFMAKAKQPSEPRDWTCPTHGAGYGDNNPDKFGMSWACPDCEREEQRVTRDFRCQWSLFRHWRSRSGIPFRYRAVTAAHVKPAGSSGKTLATAVGAYVAKLKHRLDTGEGLLLLGPPGLGKTLALSTVVNEACKSVAAVYAIWPDTLADLKSGFSGPRDDERRNAVIRLRDVPLLALDELGVKGMSDFDHSELFALIDYRYREGLPTLAAANATLANFASLVGERIADRLRETGPVLSLTGDSLRGKVEIVGPDAIPEPPEEITVQVHSQGAWKTRTIYAPDEY